MTNSYQSGAFQQKMCGHYKLVNSGVWPKIVPTTEIAVQ